VSSAILVVAVAEAVEVERLALVRLERLERLHVSGVLDVVERLWVSMRARW